MSEEIFIKMWAKRDNPKELPKIQNHNFFVPACYMVQKYLIHIHFIHHWYYPHPENFRYNKLLLRCLYTWEVAKFFSISKH